MNKKKYISAGVFFFVIVLGAGIAYDVDPAPINSVLGINSVDTNSIADIDLSLLGDGSSSLPTPDQAMNTSDASASAPSGGGLSQKNTGATTQAGAPQDKGAILPSPSAVHVPATDVDDTSDDETTSSAPAAAAPAIPCSFPARAPSTTSEIILNEVAWMGSASSSNAEWVELKNNSSDTVDLSGWKLLNASGKFAVSFSDGDAIAPGGFFLLERGSAGSAAGVPADVPVKIYSGDLVNGGDTLALMDPQCGAADYIDALSGWPAGNNTTKATMERDADGAGWHTSALPGGTPGAENSAGPPPAQHALVIAFEGDAGGATIASDPAGLVCGASCIGSFASGTEITLTPAAGPNAAFGGWSGLCYGETICSFAISATTSLTADFNSTLSTSDDDGGTPIPGTDTSPSSTDPMASSTPTAPPPPQPSGGHILIAAVQIAGASSDNDLVALYNPTAAAVDMSGWKLHKRSATGVDYSLKVFPAGSVIAAGGSFTWANSENGFSETAGANVSSTETLSANNSVALLDAAGNAIDAVAWGTGTSQYGEGPPYPTSPGANQLLSRRSSGGTMADTDDNANDFTIQ